MGARGCRRAGGGQAGGGGAALGPMGPVPWAQALASGIYIAGVFGGILEGYWAWILGGIGR